MNRMPVYAVRWCAAAAALSEIMAKVPFRLERTQVPKKPATDNNGSRSKLVVRNEIRYHDTWPVPDPDGEVLDAIEETSD